MDSVLSYFIVAWASVSQLSCMYYKYSVVSIEELTC
jgi:hypothetical protein